MSRRTTIWIAVLLAAMLAGAAASTAGSSATQAWTLTNVVTLARHRYPDYVEVRFVGIGRGGAIVWTARRIATDGSTVEVFSWRNGRLADLGSPGKSKAVFAVNRRGQFLVGTRVVAPLGGPGIPSGPVTLPPRHSYLWQDGKLTSLGSLGGSNTVGIAINDRGQIVGSSDTEKGTHAASHAFLWQGGKMTDLGTLGGRFSEATAINDRGQVIGTSATRLPQRQHGFIWQDGKMTDLGTLGGWTSNPVAINERGQVIGQSTTPRGTDHRFQGQAFFWQHGKMTELPTLNLTGEPVSCELNSILPKCAHPCPPRLPAGCKYWRSVVTAINDRGEVVGTSVTDVDQGRAFLWRDGKMTDLGTLGGRSSGATGIDDSGRIVGWSDTKFVPYTAFSAPGPRPFVWQHGRLLELPMPIGTPSQALSTAPDGAIIGGADYPAGYQLLVWKPRPRS